MSKKHQIFSLNKLNSATYEIHIDAHKPQNVSLLNNLLHLNTVLFRFKIVDSPLCSYYNEEEETLLHLFYSCLKTKQLWNKLRQYFSQFINIPHSTPRSFILGIFDIQHSGLINNLLLIFKFYIYNARNTK